MLVRELNRLLERTNVGGGATTAMAAVNGMKVIDPVLLAVLKGRLEQIADEMDATLFRSAFNPIIAEAHDASHGLYHADTDETLIKENQAFRLRGSHVLCRQGCDR